MPDFMRQHVGLRELAGRTKAPLELVVETKIDVNLLIARAVEGARSGFRAAATRLRVVAEEDELGVVVLLVGLFGEKFRPGFLSVVQDKGNKLNQRSFGGIARRVRTIRGHGGAIAGRAASEQREEILLEDQAEHEQNQRAANSDVHAAELKSAATAARFVAAIFDVLAITTGCPAHRSLS